MRLLIIEDDKNLCKAMKIHLIDAGYQMDFCYDGEEGLYCAEQNAYDLILLDRMLPLLGGLEILTRLRAQEMKTPVLMITALNTIDDKVDGLDAGADDYLIKPFDTKELLARVRALLRRSPQLEEGFILQVADVQLNLQERTLSGSLGSKVLSKREANLLEPFFKNFERTLPRAYLFAHVWGSLSETEEGNLDTYVYYIRRRLKAVSNQLQICTVRSAGYRLEEIIC